MLKRDTEPKSNKVVLILNPNSQGGATGENWKTTYQEIRNSCRILIAIANDSKELQDIKFGQGFVFVHH